jgi:hypothetical protein
MNCMEFRRAALANPLHPGHEALKHEADCPDCTHFYQALRAQEEVLYEAMNVPVPDGLADRILLRQSRGWRERFLPRFVIPALAASIALAIGLGFGLGRDRLQHDLAAESLAAGIAAHVLKEPQALASEQNLPVPMLAKAVSRSGGELLSAFGQVSYVQRCPLPGGGTGEHLVFNMPQGKVTLILMPTKTVASAIRLFKDGLNVSVLPAGDGSLALIAETDEQIREAEQWAMNGLRWKERT